MNNIALTLLSTASHPITEQMNRLLKFLIELSVVAIEFLGLIVIVVTGLKAFAEWLKKDRLTRLHLSEGLSTALSFLLCGEILRTIVTHEIYEVALIGGIVLLRVALTLLIHWEAKKEKEELDEHHKKNSEK